MKKTFKHEGKSCTVEVETTKSGHRITGIVEGKEESIKYLPPEDDVVHYAEQMEEELKIIAKRPRKAANPHLKKLKDKGYK